MSVRAETRKYVFSIKSTNAKTRVAFVLVIYYICMPIVCVYISLCVMNSRQEHNLSSNSYENKQGRNCIFKALIRYKRIQYGSHSQSNKQNSINQIAIFLHDNITLQNTNQILNKK